MRSRIFLTICLLVACAWCLVSVTRADRPAPAPPTTITQTPADHDLG